MKHRLFNTQNIFGRIVIIGSVSLVLLIFILFVVAIIERIKFGVWPEINGIAPYTDPDGKFHRGKTLWDLLELIIVPLVLVVVGFLFSSSQSNIRDKISRDNQRESALQEYFNKIANLTINHELKKSEPGDEVRAIARTLTFTTLKGLDGERKGALLLFLKEAKLILAPKDEMDSRHNPIIHSDNFDFSNVILTDSFLQDIWLPWAKIKNADLSYSKLNGADLRGVDLSKANLSNTELMRTSLSEAKLKEVDLRAAKLFEADLRYAELQNADLRQSDLYGAKLQGTDLSGTKLEGANLSKAEYTDATIVEPPANPTKWPEGFDPIQAGAILKVY